LLVRAAEIVFHSIGGFLPFPIFVVERPVGVLAVL
jgi:hypothetical protein